MNRNEKISMASNNTRKNTYTIDTGMTDIIDIAYKYGKAESGEIIELIGDNGELIARAGWDSQYNKYRRQLDDGRWQ